MCNCNIIRAFGVSRVKVSFIFCISNHQVKMNNSVLLCNPFDRKDLYYEIQISYVMHFSISLIYMVITVVLTSAKQ